jgi:hypothetical protein
MSKTARIVEVTAMDMEKASDTAQSPKPTNLHQVREGIVRMVCEHALEMVLGTIAEANKGHYAAMKFLFEMTGLYPASSMEEDREGDGLAKLLLEQLGISPEPADAVAECSQLASMANGHAVK